MRKPRIITTIAGGIVLLIVVAVIILMQRLDSIVETAIERHGTEAAGTPVQVDRVNISLQDGEGTVRGVTIQNPEGFPREPIFRLGRISITLDKDSLIDDIPVVENVQIREPFFLYMVNREGEINLNVLRNYLQGHTGAEGKSEGETEGDPPRIRISRVTIEKGQGVLDLSAVGGKRMTVDLPALTLTDLGGENGLTPGQVTERLLAALAEKVSEVAAQAGVEDILRGQGESLQKEVEDMVPGTSEALKKMLGQ